MSNDIILKNIINLIGGWGKKGSYIVSDSPNRKKSKGLPWRMICCHFSLCLCCLLCLGFIIAINVAKAEEPRPTDGEYIPDNSVSAEWVGEEEPPLEDTVTLTFIYNSIFALNKVYKKIRVKKGSIYKFGFWDVPFAFPLTVVGWSEQRFLDGPQWYLKRDQSFIDMMNKTSIGVNAGTIPPYKILYAAGIDSYVANKDTVFYAVWGKWVDALYRT